MPISAPSILWKAFDMRFVTESIDLAHVLIQNNNIKLDKKRNNFTGGSGNHKRNLRFAFQPVKLFIVALICISLGDTQE